MQENVNQDAPSKVDSYSNMTDEIQNTQREVGGINQNSNHIENRQHPATLPLQSQNTSAPLSRHSSLKLLQVKQRQIPSVNVSIQNSKKKFFYLSQSINKKRLSENETYTDWKVYHNKSDLKILPFPYCVDQPSGMRQNTSTPLSLFTSIRNPFKERKQETKQNPTHFPKLYKLKIDNKVQVRPLKQTQKQPYRPIFNYEKTPVNEYLNYDLAEEINSGLRDVQILADENRKIRKAKRQDNEANAKQKTKLTRGIKVKRQYVKNYKGLYKNDH